MLVIFKVNIYEESWTPDICEDSTTDKDGRINLFVKRGYDRRKIVPLPLAVEMMGDADKENAELPRNAEKSKSRRSSRRASMKVLENFKGGNSPRNMSLSRTPQCDTPPRSKGRGTVYKVTKINQQSSSMWVFLIKLKAYCYFCFAHSADSDGS